MEIRLQYVGMVKAEPAGNIKVGDRLMWNGGSTDEVVAVRFAESGKTMWITEKTDDGRIWPERKMTTTRGVAIVRDGKITVMS